ncbi:hypothetical protein [Hydrocoleum sp. CS-953]
MPTEKQAVNCFIMCQRITQMYLPISLVRSCPLVSFV